MYRVCENGIYRDATAEEIEKLEKMRQKSQNQVKEPTLEEHIKQLQKENQMLTDCLLEMSEIVYQ